MKIVRSHMSAFSRQVHEAVLIEMNGSGILNSKGEFNRCQLPRLSVQMGEMVVKEHDNILEMTEEEVEDEIERTRTKKRNHRESEMNEAVEHPAKKRRKTNGKRPEPNKPRKRLRDEIEPRETPNKRQRECQDQPVFENVNEDVTRKECDKPSKIRKIRTIDTDFTQLSEKQSQPPAEPKIVSSKTPPKNESNQNATLFPIFNRSLNAVSKTNPTGTSTLPGRIKVENKAHPTHTTPHPQHRTRLKNRKIISSKPSKLTNIVKITTHFSPKTKKKCAKTESDRQPSPINSDL